jgi:hypothetical protein
MRLTQRPSNSEDFQPVEAEVSKSTKQSKQDISMQESNFLPSQRHKKAWKTQPEIARKCTEHIRILG